MAITSAVGDVFKAFYELFASVFNAVYNVLHGFISIIVGFFTGIVNLIVDVVEGVFNALGTSTKVFVHNFDKLVWVVLGVGLALAISRYTTSGRQVTAGKRA